jgi:Fic family protein
VTKRETFVEILSVLTDPAQKAFVEHEIELIDKRKNAPRKPTAEQKANEALKARIVDELPTEGATATDIANGLEVSVQKASQLLRQLVEAGFVTRVEGKGKNKTLFVPAE